MTAAGRIVAGRYRLDELIGSGGQGRVWRATDQLLDRRVALKQVSSHESRGEAYSQARQRMVREARAAARLHHPHVVEVFDLIHDGDEQWLVMEYVEAESLAQRIDRHGRLPPHVVARIGVQLAAALAAAHQHGIVHRDVKPANVLVTGDMVKLTDFGIARVTGDTELTRTGAVIGSLAYLAPEIARGDPAGPPSDVFGLGATLYAAVEGTPPFPDEDGNPFAHLRRIGEGRVPPPQHADALTSPLRMLLDPVPLGRPTAAQASMLLAEVAHGPVGGPASPLTALPQPRKRTARRPHPAALLAAAVVAAVLVVAVVLPRFVEFGGSGAGDASAGTVTPTPAAASPTAPSVAPRACTWTPSSEELVSRQAPLPAPTAGTAGTVAVTVQTDQGRIPMTLDRSVAPCTVENFLSLVTSGFFDDTPCHRLTTNPQLRVLQCGDPSGSGTGGPGYTIPDEPPTHLAPAAGGGASVYPRGTVAMAKSSAPNSAGSQFFLVYGDSTIAPEYAVFGTVEPEGLVTLDAVARAGAQDTNGPGDGAPRTPVTIRTAEVG